MIKEVYRYEAPANSDELVGELLTDITPDRVVQEVDASNREQVAELAQIVNEFGSRKEIPEVSLELARMVLASRVNGWLETNESLYEEWQKTHRGYIDINGEQSTPAALLKVREPYRDDESYGYYMSLLASDALMLDYIKISSQQFGNDPRHASLRSRYEGYGKLLLGHGRNVPSAQGLQGQQLLYMLLRSGSSKQPVSAEERESWSGNRVARLHYALGKEAVLSLPDYLHQTGNFTEETLLEELGKMGMPLRHSELYRNHNFNDDVRQIETESLRQRLLGSLLIAGSIMTDEVRGRVASYDIDPVALTARLEQDFATVEGVAPFIRKNNSESYRSFGGTYKPPVKRLQGASVELEAWEREVEGFDKELVEHALGVNEPF